MGKGLTNEPLLFVEGMSGDASLLVSGRIANERLPSSILIDGDIRTLAGILASSVAQLGRMYADQAFVTGDVQAGGFFLGDGSRISNLPATSNASLLTSGTLSNDRLPGVVTVEELNATTGTFETLSVIGETVMVDSYSRVLVARSDGMLNASGLTVDTDTGAVTMNGNVHAAYVFANGAYVTDLNASAVTRGTLATERLPTNVTIPGVYSGNGSGLTDLVAEELTGTIDTARLPSTISVAGTVIASGFTGNGADLTHLPAEELTGTVNNARLPANISVGNVTVSGVLAGLHVGSFSGNGAGLANLAAGQLTGTVNNARLPANISVGNVTVSGVLAGSHTGSFSGNGAGLANLAADKLTGTVNNARLPANISVVNVAASGTLSGTHTGSFSGAHTGTFSGNGAGLANLAAEQLTGTVNNARLPADISVSNVTVSGTVAGSHTGNFSGTHTGSYAGDGGGLSNIAAEHLTGSVNNARLPADISVSNVTVSGTVAGSHTGNFSGTHSGTYAGNGAGLANLAAGNLTGTVINARLPADISVANVTVSGTVSGSHTGTFSGAHTGTFDGNGAGLSSIAAANLTGTVINARLPADISVVNVAASGTISGSHTGNFSGAHSGTFSGDGGNLANLAAEQLTGTVNNSRLPADISVANVTVSGTSTGSHTGNFSGAHSGSYAGNGAGLTNLAAAQLTGTVNNSRLPASISVTSVTATTLSGNHTGTFSGNGAGLSQLPAGNLTGTISNSRLPSSISVDFLSGNGAGILGLTNAALPRNLNIESVTAASFTGNGAGLTHLDAGALVGEINAQVDLGTLEFDAGTAAAPGVFFVADNSSGMYLPSYGVLGLAANGVQRARIDDAGAYFTGNVEATGFIGPGSGLTGLDASAVTTGTIANDRLPSSIAVTSVTANFIGNGAGLTSLPAESLTGTVSNSRLPSSISVSGTVTAGTLAGAHTGTFAGTHTGNYAGNGAGLVSLAASAITGTILNARLPSDISVTSVTATTFSGDHTGTFTGTHSGNGAGLTDINAEVLTGTVSNARLPSSISVPGTVTASTFTGDGGGVSNIQNSALPPVVNVPGNIQTGGRFIGNGAGLTYIDASVLVGQLNPTVDLGDLEFDAGTAAAPGIPFMADPGTGMYLPSVGNLGFATSGVQRLSVNANGIVVVGNVSGQYILGNGAYLTGVQTGLVMQPNIVLVSDATGNISNSTVTTTELGYLSGVTSPIQLALDSKTDIGHVHAIANVTGLQGALDTKTDLGHVHAIANITGLQTELSGLQASIDGKTDLGHGHAIANVTGLQTALDTKTDLGHVHAIANVTGLQSALDGKTEIGHVHAIANVTGLQSALDGKTEIGHVHAIANVTGLQGALGTKTDLGHVHAIANITGLQGALDTKTAIGHVHAIANVTGLQTALNAKQATISGAASTVVTANLTVSRAVVSDAAGKLAAATTTSTEIGYLSGVTGPIQSVLDTKTDLGHVHAIANITGLQTELSGLQASIDGKTDLGHGHAIANVTGLQTALDTKTDLGHGHAIANVTGLQTALDTKTDLGHVHAIANVTGLQSALDGKTEIGHVHAIANVTGLQGALDTKTDLGHVHAIANITGLQTALDDKTDIGHVHTIANVTGLQTELTGLQASIDTKTDLGHVHAIANVAGLQTALDAKQATISGAASTVAIANLTVSRAVVSDAAGKLAAATTTSTEIGYVAGLTSNAQAQIDARANIASPSFTGNVTISENLTVSGLTSAVSSIVMEDLVIDGASNTMVYIDADGTLRASTIDVSDAGDITTSAVVTANVARANLGTAALPGFSFATDTNTGTYSPGSDIFAVSTGGVERVRIDAAGRVGIGTTAPDTDHTLHVVGNAYIDGYILGNGAYLTGIVGTGGGGTTNASDLNSGVLALAYGGTGQSSSGSTGSGNVVFATEPTFNGNVVVNGNITADHIYGNIEGDFIFADDTIEIGNITATGSVAAATFTGSGAGLTNLNAGNVTSGVLAIARGGSGTGTATGSGSLVLAASPTLTGTVTAANVTLGNLTATNTVTAATFSGSGASLTALDASELTTGTIPDARISGSLTGLTGVTASGTVTAGTFSGSGASLTALNASALTTGTIPDARITGDLTGLANITTSGVLNFGSRVQNNLICLNGSSLDPVATAFYGFGINAGTLRYQVDTTGASHSFYGGTTLFGHINSGGLESQSLGTALLPAFSFVTDPNTGIWSPAADTLAMSTAGVERMRITSTGLFGIGKTPGVQLDLSTDGARKLTTTAWTTGSDVRIKENIELANLDICYETVKSIPLKRFAWKESYAPLDIQDDRRVLGWIAQDVEQVFAKAVTSSSEYGLEDFRTLNSDQLVKAMWGALQKVISDKEALEARLAAAGL